MIKKFKSFVKRTGNMLTKEELLKDTFAAQQLQPLLANAAYLPFSSSSLRYSSVAVILNDIVIHNRKCILEFGSGISTYLIAALLKRNKLDGRVLISIDENENWIDIVKNTLQKDNLHGNVQFVHAPLVQTDLALNNEKWYDTIKLSDALKGATVDCVLVDGPSAWHEAIRFSRYPALPFINAYLGDNASVFLDDTNREGEQRIIELWKEKYNYPLSYLNSSFAGFFKGESYNINLFK